MNQWLVVAAAVVVFVLVAVIEARNQCAGDAHWQACEWVGSTALLH